MIALIFDSNIFVYDVYLFSERERYQRRDNTIITNGIS